MTLTRALLAPLLPSGLIILLAPFAVPPGSLPYAGYRARVDIRALHEAVSRYADDHDDEHPESLETLLVPGERGVPYIENHFMLRDPWGRAYRYEPPTHEAPRYRIYSHGSDGRPGGEGDARDVDNLDVVPRLRGVRER